MPQAQAIVTLNSETQALALELPGINGARRKVNVAEITLATHGLARARKLLETEGASVNALREALDEAINAYDALRERSKLEFVIRTCLQGMEKQRYEIGRDGAPTQAQVRHWQRHGMRNEEGEFVSADGNVAWGDPQCPFCIAEGRFEPKQKRDKRINKADSAALALRALNYVERTAGKWFHTTEPHREAVFVSPTGVIAGARTGRYSKAQTQALRDRGQAEANRLNYTSPEFRRDRLASYSDGTVVRKAAPATKQQREAAIAAKVARVAQTITF